MKEFIIVSGEDEELYKVNLIGVPVEDIVESSDIISLNNGVCTIHVPEYMLEDSNMPKYLELFYLLNRFAIEILDNDSCTYDEYVNCKIHAINDTIIHYGTNIITNVFNSANVVKLHPAFRNIVGSVIPTCRIFTTKSTVRYDKPSPQYKGAELLSIKPHELFVTEYHL